MARRWKQVAGGVAMVGIVAVCGGLGYHAGKLRQPETPVATAQVTTAVTTALALPARADFGSTPAPADVRALADWVVANRDHGQRNFAIVDKSNPSVYVFAPQGRLVGKAPALVGLAVGDESVPGIGERPVDKVRPHERTTPAGRFVTSPGTNLTGEEVIWVDYQRRGLDAQRARAGRGRAPAGAPGLVEPGRAPHFLRLHQPAARVLQDRGAAGVRAAGRRDLRASGDAAVADDRRRRRALKVRRPVTLDPAGALEAPPDEAAGAGDDRQRRG